MAATAPSTMPLPPRSERASHADELADRAVMALSGPRPDVTGARHLASEAQKHDPAQPTAEAVLKLTRERDLPRADAPPAQDRAPSDGAGTRSEATDIARNHHAARNPWRAFTERDAPAGRPRPESARRHASADRPRRAPAADPSAPPNPDLEAVDDYKRRATDAIARHDYPAALANADRALDLSPADVSALDLRAYSQTAVGLPEDAILTAMGALDIDPRDARAHLAIGLANERLGRIAAMVSSLKKAARLDRRLFPHYKAAAARNGLAVEPIDLQTNDEAFSRKLNVDRRSRARRSTIVLTASSGIVGLFLIISTLIGAISQARRRAASDDMVRGGIGA
ncbi:MAG: tetratricopeptide repeat protein [Elusimicrobia bacterium]|nr:tetratricopeptide repeat protein [Elusimicrobiota bacterium]